MANFSNPHGGPYASKDPFLYTELNALIDSLLKAPNFDEGSSHAPTDDIELSGSMGGGFVFADMFPFSGELDIFGDVGVLASSAANWTFGTDVTVQTLGPLDIYAAATIKSGGSFVTVSGGTSTFGGQVNFDGNVDFRSGSDVEIKSGCTWDFESGATVGLAATLTVTGQISVTTGSLTVGASGSILSVGGAFTWTGGTVDFSGAVDVDFNSGSVTEVKSGADWTFASGSTLALAGAVTATGGVTFASGTYPLLSSRTWTERATRIAVTTYGANGADPGPADANMWIRRDAGSSVPTYLTATQDAGGGETVIEFTNLPHGQTIASVSIEVNGTDVQTPDSYPTYRIVRWQDGGGGFENMSDLATDQHASTLDWGTNKQTTEVTVNAHATIDRSYRYGLRIVHPWLAAPAIAMQIFDVWAEGTQTSVQR